MMMLISDNLPAPQWPQHPFLCLIRSRIKNRDSIGVCIYFYFTRILFAFAARAIRRSVLLKVRISSLNSASGTLLRSPASIGSLTLSFSMSTRSPSIRTYSLEQHNGHNRGNRRLQSSATPLPRYYRSPSPSSPCSFFLFLFFLSFFFRSFLSCVFSALKKNTHYLFQAATLFPFLFPTSLLFVGRETQKTLLPQSVLHYTFKERKVGGRKDRREKEGRKRRKTGKKREKKTERK